MGCSDVDNVADRNRRGKVLIFCYPGGTNLDVDNSRSGTSGGVDAGFEGPKPWWVRNR